MIGMTEEQSALDPAAEFRQLPPRVTPEEMVEIQALVPPADAQPVGTTETEWRLRAGGAG